MSEDGQEVQELRTQIGRAGEQVETKGDAVLLGGWSMLATLTIFLAVLVADGLIPMWVSLVITGSCTIALMAVWQLVIQKMLRQRSDILGERMGELPRADQLEILAPLRSHGTRTIRLLVRSLERQMDPDRAVLSPADAPTSRGAEVTPGDAP